MYCLIFQPLYIIFKINLANFVVSLAYPLYDVALYIDNIERSQIYHNYFTESV